MCADCPQPRVLPANLPLVMAYLACATQWRHAGMGGVRTGMDYPGCEAAIRAHWPAARPRKRARLLRGVRMIEWAILEADAEIRAAEAPHLPPRG